MATVHVDLDMRSCGELGLTVIVWCSGCGRGLQMPLRLDGLRLIDLLDRARCKSCGAPARRIDVEHRLKGGSKFAYILKLERDAPPTARG